MMDPLEMIEAIKANYPPENYMQLREALDHCTDLLAAEASGRMLLLPCKMDERIYTVVITDRRRGARPCKHPVYCVKQGRLTWNNLPGVIKEYGKTVFLTKEAAIATMETMKKERVKC